MTTKRYFLTGMVGLALVVGCTTEDSNVRNRSSVSGQSDSMERGKVTTGYESGTDEAQKKARGSSSTTDPKTGEKSSTEGRRNNKIARKTNPSLVLEQGQRWIIYVANL